MNHTHTRSFFIVSTIFFLISCQGQKPADLKPEETKDEATEKTPEGLSPEQAAKVVAEVGERKITVGEVTEQINRLSPYIRRRWAAPEKRKEFLQKLIRVELLSQEAEQLGLDKDPEVMRTVKQVMIRLMVKNDLEESVLPTTVDEKMLREEYKKDHAKYHRPAQIRASQTVLASEAEAIKVIEQLEAKKDDRKYFRDTAKKISNDEETKGRGGDLGYFSKPDLAREDEPKVPKAVAEKAWTIEKVGDVASKPVKTEAGFHVIKLTNKKPEMNRTFESVKRLIENRILRQLRREKMDEFVEELRKKAKREIFEENRAKRKVVATEGPAHGAQPKPGARQTSMPPMTQKPKAPAGAKTTE